MSISADVSRNIGDSNFPRIPVIVYESLLDHGNKKVSVKMLGIKKEDHVMLKILENVNINRFPRKMNKKKRIVRKGGLTNVTYKNISKKRRRYISDLYTTLLDSSWSYVVLLFASSFYGSWILFGGIPYCNFPWFSAK